MFLEVLKKSYGILVDEGVAWLDEHEPDWRRRIDVDDLRMESNWLCVLGQMWGHFGALIPLYEGSREAASQVWLTFARRHGFMTIVENDEHWDVLTEIWRERAALVGV